MATQYTPEQYVAYYKHAAATASDPKHKEYYLQMAQHYSQATAAGASQQPSHTSSSSKSSKSSKSKSSKTPSPKRPKSSGQTLLDIEKQWTAAYSSNSSAQHQQQHQQTNGDWQLYDDEGDEDDEDGMRYLEPNFAAFTLAGGKSYLEDGRSDSAMGFGSGAGR